MGRRNPHSHQWEKDPGMQESGTRTGKGMHQPLSLAKKDLLGLPASPGTERRSSLNTQVPPAASSSSLCWGM